MPSTIPETRLPFSEDGAYPGSGKIRDTAEEALNKLGYQQELKRGYDGRPLEIIRSNNAAAAHRDITCLMFVTCRLNLFTNFGFSFSIISILTGITGMVWATG